MPLLWSNWPLGAVKILNILKFSEILNILKFSEWSLGEESIFKIKSSFPLHPKYICPRCYQQCWWKKYKNTREMMSSLSSSSSSAGIDSASIDAFNNIGGKKTTYQIQNATSSSSQEKWWSEGEKPLARESASIGWHLSLTCCHLCRHHRRHRHYLCRHRYYPRHHHHCCHK